MILAISLACALIAADSTAAATPTTLDREAYQAARLKAGRDPDANVRLALWCEARGLDAERIKHLSLAALADPSHATARALLGLVAEGGRWAHPETLADRLKADPSASTLRAQYEERRAKAEPTADDQWKLARWCERVGLVDEAWAHDSAVTRIDPTRVAAWRKLGCLQFEGQWMLPEQADAIKVDREAQALADRRWLPLLETWKEELRKPKTASQAEQNLLGVIDPRAVRSIWTVFATTRVKDQARAVRMLGQVDSTEASRKLAFIAVFGAGDEVRRSAIETLRNRDLRGTLEPVIALLRDPIKYAARRVGGPWSPGVIYVETKDANYERFYPTETVRMPRRIEWLALAIDDATDRANRRFEDDLRSLRAENETIEATNKHALNALKGVTGKTIDLDPIAWTAWWTDKKGYAFVAPDANAQTAQKPTITQIIEPYERPHSYCFGAGTPVRTVAGLRPIEEIQVGDRILTQDTTTGALSYQPTLAVLHNPPTNTLRLKVGGDEVVATGIHRFWKAGQGWVMARELKVGDSIRSLGGIARVESVEPDEQQPVFNLEVAKGADFFVGRAGVLVHDNNLVEPVARPFDATPDLEAIAPRR